MIFFRPISLGQFCTYGEGSMVNQRVAAVSINKEAKKGTLVTTHFRYGLDLEKT